MAKISFKVSSRTARLIGGDNIANAEGALIELVKNSYDAEAENSLVFFDNYWMKYFGIISEKEFQNLTLNLKEEQFQTQEKILSCFKYNDKEFSFSIEEDQKQDSFAAKFFISKCSLFIADNGEGMNEDIIKNQWMTIGTSNKLNSPITKNKLRIKSGEKGIGRFALDRLGQEAKMYTVQEKSVGQIWKVNWNDFEKKNTLGEVYADLDDDENLSIKEQILKLSNGHSQLKESIKSVKFNTGTLIHISSLKDSWDYDSVKSLYQNLEVLIPPRETSDFKISLFSTLNTKDYGDVEASACDDFDYKLYAKLNKDSTISYEIIRKELNWKEIHPDVFKEKSPVDMSKPPYNLASIKKGGYKNKIDLNDILPSASVDLVKSNIGEFDFVFYFMRRTTKDSEKNALKTFITSKRANWLDRFGGIKIYRDDFRVRPYGEKASNAFDWLGLGARAAVSKFGVSQKSNYGWRIGPDQVYGVINISKLKNLGLLDQSNRGGLIENDTYFLFKELIIGLIHLVEKDRHNILRPISVVRDRNDEVENAKKEVIEFAKKTLKNKEKKEKINNSKGGKSEENKDENRDETYAKGVKKLLEDSDEKDNEIRMLRSLASLGLTIATFSHELEEISGKMSLMVKKLDVAVKKEVSVEKVKGLTPLKNPHKLVDSVSLLSERMNNWIEFSNNIIKKDRRKAKDLELHKYFKDFDINWKELLDSRKSKLFFVKDFEEIKIIKAFPIDLDSIFNNLITNSLEAFYVGKSSKRNIIIDYEIIDSGICFHYQDTGPGLSKKIKNNQKIYEPFYSTKDDNDGIGLGMWIVKATVESYNGYVEIIEDKPGFNLKLFFPKISR